MLSEPIPAPDDLAVRSFDVNSMALAGLLILLGQVAHDADQANRFAAQAGAEVVFR